jgi:hypothetical protein
LKVERLEAVPQRPARLPRRGELLQHLAESVLLLLLLLVAVKLRLLQGLREGVLLLLLLPLGKLHHRLGLVAVNFRQFTEWVKSHYVPLSRDSRIAASSIC